MKLLPLYSFDPAVISEPVKNNDKALLRLIYQIIDKFKN